jgi:hypothetical protein
MALQPLLGPGLPQQTFLFFLLSDRLLSPLIPKICIVSLQMTSSYLVLGLPTSLAKYELTKINSDSRGRLYHITYFLLHPHLSFHLILYSEATCVYSDVMKHVAVYHAGEA